MKNPPRLLRGSAERWGNSGDSSTNYVAGLIALGTFEQVELDSLSFIQCAVAIFLNGGEMYEHVLAGGALDKSITLGSVEPLHCTLLSHRNTPFASVAKNSCPCP